MIYLQLFWTFFKIGLFTIGGGMAMIPLIQNAVVIDHGWITQELFIDFIGIAESTPGPMAINIGTFIGYELGGILGVLITTLGLFLPSFIIIFTIYKLSSNFMKKPAIKDMFLGLQPTVVALITSALVMVSIAACTFTSSSGVVSFNWFGVVLAIACFLVMQFAKKVHPIIIIIASAGIGILFYGFIL
ncbi:MAG: chromate transporter [Clostridia bacterium]